MEINLNVKTNLQIRAFYLFFIIAGLQLGVGIIGAPRFIYLEAERDSWLAILIAFLFTCLVVAAMFTILNQYENADYFGIHVDVFGKWLGRILGTLFILYICISFLSILMTYIQVIQIFLYHALPNCVLTVLIMILVVYAVFGGVRVVVGVTFILFIITFWLIVTLYDPFIRMNWDNFLPLFQSSFPELLKGAKATAYTLSGFEILMVIYPFVKNKNKAKLPTFLGLTYTAIALILVTMISIGYFSPTRLKNINWAVLILVKSTSFTFLERLDYIVVVGWLLVIIPNLVLLMWAIAHGMKRMYSISQKKTHWVVTILILIIVNYFRFDYQITALTDWVAKLSFWVVYIYPFILLPLVLLKKKWKNKKGSGSS
ncbi:GerAB/ArcD/ProY family transporter [Ornithinibacillus sp. JPR2-1]|uniref:GerAB/ArcD/ProY family transporter n=1 Tax=Ornithinibacillus sp. JPR2-1 TaxID=2094019 RepID=UPI0031E03C6E